MSSRTRGLVAGLVIGAAMALPATASAWIVQVHIHGAGGVEEVLNRFGEEKHQMDCTVGPSGRSESSPPVTCQGGSANGLWNSTNIVRLAPKLTQEATNRGWRFSHWVDSSANGQVNCDPPDTTGPFSTPSFCEFQIFGNLQTNLYFDDTHGPDNTTITGGPTGTIRTSTATFDFNASDDPDASFECKFDRPGITGVYVACGGPSDKSESYTGLTDGSYTFTVRGKDPSGNPDGTPASRTITVDQTAPNTFIDSGPDGPTADATPTFAFSSSEASSTFACFVDSQPVTCSAASSHTPATDLSDGSHTFAVAATDAAGNPDGSAASRSFTVDTTAPEVTILERPKPRVRLKGRRKVARVTFGFSADDPAAEFSCRIDEEPAAPCTSPQTYKVRRGSHTFRVSASDALDNSSDPQAIAFKVVRARR